MRPKCGIVPIKVTSAMNTDCVPNAGHADQHSPMADLFLNYHGAVRDAVRANACASTSS